MTEYKIVIVDDHELIINGFINALTPWPRYRVVAHISNGLAAYNVCRLHHPDIIVLDLGLPEINGLDIIPQLHNRWPEMKILIYTACKEEHVAVKSLAAGADGYVLKNSSLQILLAALQMISVNKRYIDPALNREAIKTALDLNKTSNQLLTIRERQILKLINEGNTNKIIGEKLFISIKTVETHRLNMMRKFKVHKVVELLHCARRIGLLD